MRLSPRQLYITNFKSVRKPLTLDFTSIKPGLYFIRGINEVKPRLGSNGVGKSSIFIDSLYWVLTGSTARSKRPGSDIVNWNNDKANTKVSFTFSLDSDIHCVDRSRNPNNLELDGHKVEQSEIDKLFPLTDSALRRSILIDQFGDMFLTLKPEEKSRIFSDTLNLDIWLKASDNASKRIALLEKSIREDGRRLAGIAGALREARDQLELALSKEEAFDDDITKIIAEQRLLRRAADKDASEAAQVLNDARTRFASYGNKDRSVETILNLKRLRQQRQNNIINFKSLAKGEENIYNQYTLKLREYDKTDVCPECGQIVSVEHVEEKRKVLETSMKESREEHKSLSRSIEDAELSLQTIDKELEDLETSLIDYNKAQSEVALCAEKSLNKDRYLHQLDDEIEKLKIKVNPFTKQCDDLEIRVKNLKKESKELKELVDDEERDYAICKFWQKGFKEIRLDQIDSCLMEFEIAANNHAEALGLEGWSFKFNVERETKQGSISHGFSVLLHTPDLDEPVPFESYSGGETQRLQFGATFGLSEVLLERAGVSTDFEILDEPTIHLSSEGIEDLLSRLRDRALDLNRRIFVIDQMLLDKGAFDDVITVRKTENGIVLDDNGLLSPPTTVKPRVKL